MAQSSRSRLFVLRGDASLIASRVAGAPVRKKAHHSVDLPPIVVPPPMLVQLTGQPRELVADSQAHYGPDLIILLAPVRYQDPDLEGG